MNINKSLQNKKIYLLLSLILTLACSLRIYNLGGESIWHDEAFSISVAKGTIMQIINASAHDVHPPLHYILLHYWIIIFGDSETSTRFLSVIYGVLSVFVIFKLGTEMFNKEIGILSSFIFSISLYGIKYSQEVRDYSLMVLLVLISSYYFIRIMKDEKKDKTYLFDNIGYIISTVAILYTHFFGIFYVLFQNVYYFLIYKKNKKTGL